MNITINIGDSAFIGGMIILATGIIHAGINPNNSQNASAKTAFGQLFVIEIIVAVVFLVISNFF